MELFVVVVFLKQTYLKSETSFGTNIPEIPIRSESMFFSFSVTLSNPAEKGMHVLFIVQSLCKKQINKQNNKPEHPAMVLKLNMLL